MLDGGGANWHEFRGDGYKKVTNLNTPEPFVRLTENKISGRCASHFLSESET
jgi:hypothetical protein